MNKHHYVAIMAGGIGSRFWPMSRTAYPKQFLDILHTGKSLLQWTYERYAAFIPNENIFIVTSEEYVSIVQQQLKHIPFENIVAEPSRKNTAPCIAYISFKLLQKDPEASLIVAPSDHMILDPEAYKSVTMKALDFVSHIKSLVTLGITPTHPNTGYGYIQHDSMTVAEGIYKVKTFTEKPNLELAKTFISSGDFLWKDGWPVLGVDGKVPAILDLPVGKGLIPGIVASDEFTRKKGEPALPLVWQWNHNPENNLWSVTERKGYLRLKTGRTDTSFLLARNSLTQRTIGPVCTGSTLLDVSNMKDGDFAGLGLLQKNFGQIGVQVNGDRKEIVMINASSGKPVEEVRIPLTQSTVHLKAECNFTDKKDIAFFYYSLDGKQWMPLGTQLKMAYTIPQFIGYRFALFNYATKITGGIADFDFFHITDTVSEIKK